MIDVCSANRITVLDIEAILESEFPEVAVIMNSCLNYCGLCANSAYAHVNGRIISGKTPELALDKIREAIKKELAVYHD